MYPAWLSHYWNDGHTLPTSRRKSSLSRQAGGIRDAKSLRKIFIVVVILGSGLLHTALGGSDGSASRQLSRHHFQLRHQLLILLQQPGILALAETDVRVAMREFA